MTHLKLALATAALGMSLLAHPAGAADLKGGAGTFAWLSVGSSFTIQEGHPFFVGAFSGMQLMQDQDHPLYNASVQCPGYNDIGVDAAGYCIFTDAAGDKLFAKWSCTAVAPIKGTLVGCAGSESFVGGTGKFANAQGGNPFTAYTVAINPDGTASGYTLITEMTLTY